MAQEEAKKVDSPMIMSPWTTPPGKKVRAMKGLLLNGGDPADGGSVHHDQEIIVDDDQLALRKADQAAWRRYEAVDWLRQMDNGASESLPQQPSEDQFRLALRNGLILCNVLNKVKPGAVFKVVENQLLDVHSTEGAAQSAIQYFENTRNFLVAVGKMRLLTFEASHLEKGGGSLSQVVDCILCLKGYYEWKQAGGVGVWRYGGTVNITSLPKESPSPFNHPRSESTNNDSSDESESLHCHHVLQFLRLSADEVSTEETRAANALAFLFDRFGLQLIRAYLTADHNGVEEDFPLNAMVIDTMLTKVVKDFSAVIVSQRNQLGVHLKKLLRSGTGSSLSKTDLLEAISQYLDRRTKLVSSDYSKFCTCGGKRQNIWHRASESVGHSHTEVIDLQQKQLEELKASLDEARLEVKDIQSNWDHELRNLEQNIKGLQKAASSYQKVLEENRVLYNQIQDLKGAIRVYCRVKPLRGQSDGQSTVDYIGENGNIMIVNPLKRGKDARTEFTFNKVFDTNVTQEQIYVDTQPLIRSVLDGYNVCIFAYGQTGSGKTYTMAGPDVTTEETWGVNYRALSDLFDISRRRKDIFEYEVRVQMVEIYNEQVRDLLVSDGSGKRLDIRNHSQINGLNIPNACLIHVTCTEDVLNLMNVGQKNRVMSATALNERSSRSHSILTIHVQGKELVSGSIIRGCLHLVDLAGSERVDKSEVVGERLKEATFINKSLSALGDVISALAQKSNHVPYRNSKLTQVLQDSLGGQAKTLMFVHINPVVNAIGETLSTLKFAKRVASVELGAARSNKESGESRELREEISRLKLALEKKEAEVEELKAGTHRTAIESQMPGAASPHHTPRYGQRLTDNARGDETGSSSSGKQRKGSRFAPAVLEKEIPSRVRGRQLNSKKPRSPSPPPHRRSLSADRSTALIRSSKVMDDQTIAKLPLSIRTPNNTSVAAASVISSTDNDLSEGSMDAQDPTKQNISNAPYGLQNVNPGNVNPDHEVVQAFNVRQVGNRKGKLIGRPKAKHQLPAATRDQKNEKELALFTDLNAGEKMEEANKCDSIEAENEHGLSASPNLEIVHTNIPRIPQTLEQRGGKLGNKLQNPATCSTMKEAMPLHDFRRSRSTPRSKFMF